MIIICGYRHQWLYAPWGVEVGSNVIQVHIAMVIGVLFDKYLTMSDQVTSVCKAAYYHLKNIRSLKPFLDTGALLQLSMPLLHPV